MLVRIICSTYGSRPWFAVPVDKEDHPMDAVWLDSGVRSVDTMFGKVTTDGYIRYFRLKRDLVSALTANGHTLVSKIHVPASSAVSS